MLRVLPSLIFNGPFQRGYSAIFRSINQCICPLYLTSSRYIQCSVQTVFGTIMLSNIPIERIYNRLVIAMLQCQGDTIGFTALKSFPHFGLFMN